MTQIKITLDQITYGSKEVTDDVTAFVIAGDLLAKGYRKVSSAYCRVARIDREDWLEVLAKQRRCSVAHFYNVDGSGVSDAHRDHYVRSFSKDFHTVHPMVIRKMVTWR